jgi:hypothetical protein
MDREGPIHRACLQYLRLRLPGAIIHHSPNSLSLKGSEIARQIAKAKFNGMVVGFPDLLVCFNERTLFVEVKAGSNGLTPEQKQFRDAAKENGMHFVVVRSVDELAAAVEEWVNG